MSRLTAPAEAALERGDYGQCLQLLEPLAAPLPITDPEGARIRMLMVTAWMGQGQEEKALSTCRLLTRCRDSDLRMRAKQLLEVLEAPSLQRPSSWSMQIPTLRMDAQMGTRPKPSRRRRQGPPEPPPPPTGPTEAAAPGFAIVVVAVLVALTLLLGGCGQLNAEIDLVGPDRIVLGWSSDSGTGQPLPWQTTFARELKAAGTPWDTDGASPRQGRQHFASPVLHAAEAEQLLTDTVASAARASGLALPPPELHLRERNWVVGVQQHLDLTVDLEPLSDLPAPALRVTIGSGTHRAKTTTSPLQPSRQNGELVWPLQTGTRNALSLDCWRWNPLGLGSLVVLGLLALSLLLQQLRLKLGFGFPQLPS